MASKNPQYKLVGRIMAGKQVVGYGLQDINGNIERCTRDRLAFLIGRGLVANRGGQIYHDKFLIRTNPGETPIDQLPIEKIAVPAKPAADAQAQAQAQAQAAKAAAAQAAKAEQAKKAAEAKKAEQAKKAAESKKLAEAKKAEQAKKAAEAKAEKAKKAPAKKKVPAPAPVPAKAPVEAPVAEAVETVADIASGELSADEMAIFGENASLDGIGSDSELPTFGDSSENVFGESTDFGSDSGVASDTESVFGSDADASVFGEAAGEQSVEGFDTAFGATPEVKEEPKSSRVVVIGGTEYPLEEVLTNNPYASKIKAFVSVAKTTSVNNNNVKTVVYADGSDICLEFGAVDSNTGEILYKLVAKSQADGKQFTTSEFGVPLTDEDDDLSVPLDFSVNGFADEVSIAAYNYTNATNGASFTDAVTDERISELRANNQLIAKFPK